MYGQADSAAQIKNTIIFHTSLYSPSFFLAIGNLQFNKTLHSVTCVNCKLYTCLNSSISLRNESFLILRSRHNLWSPVNLQRPWEEGPMAGLAPSYLLNYSDDLKDSLDG